MLHGEAIVSLSDVELTAFVTASFSLYSGWWFSSKSITLEAAFWTVLLASAQSAQRICLRTALRTTTMTTVKVAMLGQSLLVAICLPTSYVLLNASYSSIL
jgi:hypothetical protein